MRVLVVVLAFAVATPATVAARSKRPAKAEDKKAKRVAAVPEDPYSDDDGDSDADTEAAPAAASDDGDRDDDTDRDDDRERASERRRERAEKHSRRREEPAKPKPKRRRGQSFGQPWDGHLENATRLRFADGVFIRRPQRAFGTRTTVDHLRRAINDTLELFPRAHTLAMGDLSAREGGWLSEHHSHQTGRDADVGLFYKHKPEGYPAAFVHADEDNLDPGKTWALIKNLIRTADEDGGVQLIFLDHHVSKRRLDRIFQYPHGLGAGAGIVRHEPNHDNHMHVRFKCAAADVECG